MQNVLCIDRLVIQHPNGAYFMTKFFKTLAVSTAVLAATAGIATAQDASDYTPEQVSRLQSFQADLQANNLSGAYNDMVDCGGYFEHLAETLPAIGGEAELGQVAKTMGQQFQISGMLTGTLLDADTYGVEAVQASINSKKSTYAALYPGEQIYTEASVTKMKYCGSYKAVNDTLFEFAKQMMEE